MHTRKLHDTFNTLYYGVEMRRDDPPDTWTGTPRGQGNSRWAGGDGVIAQFGTDSEIQTPKNRQKVKQRPPPELVLNPTRSAKEIPPAVEVSVGETKTTNLPDQEDHVPGRAKTFIAGCLVGMAAVLGELAVILHVLLLCTLRAAIDIAALSPGLSCAMLGASCGESVWNRVVSR